jgi:nucleotide-binding universal stress UspA family protein
MRILLPVDGSEGALAAVRHALQLVHSGLRASFVLANVQEPASLYEVVVAHNAQVIENVSTAAAAHSLEAAQALLRAAGAEYETEIALGDPGHTLIDIAERFECDMIVMGAHGVGALPRSGHFGSVANAVLHAASVPVTIVRHED